MEKGRMKRNSALSNCACSPKIEFACPEVTDFSFLCIFLFYCFCIFYFFWKKKKKLKEKKKNEENSALSNCACSPKIEFACPEVTDFSFLCISLFFLFFLEKKQKKQKGRMGSNSASVQLCLPWSHWLPIPVNLCYLFSFSE